MSHVFSESADAVDKKQNRGYKIKRAYINNKLLQVQVTDQAAK
jgi:hypothetical protein